MRNSQKTGSHLSSPPENLATGETTGETLSSRRPCEELNVSATPSVVTDSSRATDTNTSTTITNHALPSLALALLQLLKNQGAETHFCPVAVKELSRLFVDEIPENQKIRDELISNSPTWQRALYTLTYGIVTPKAVDRLYSDSARTLQDLLGALESQGLIQTFAFRNSTLVNAHGLGILTTTYLDTGVTITEEGVKLLSQNR